MSPDSSRSSDIPSSRRSAAPLRLDVAARTDAGRERHGNQDSFLVLAQGDAAVLAVCDGMGGAAGGEVASRTAVDTIRQVMSELAPGSSRDALGRRLLHSVEEASRRVHAAARVRPSLSGMGTTATACALRGDVLFIAQVGDSRAYLLRDGCLVQLTRDQTLAQMLVERGQLAPEEIATFPLGHVILQAVGTSEHVEVDLGRARLCRGDVLLICSDGLHGPLSADTLRDVLAGAQSAAAACEDLITLANAAGGPDNITAIVVRATDEALDAPSEPPSCEKARLDEDATVRVPAQVAEEIAEVSVNEDEVAAGVLARLAAIFRRRRGR
jgi:protein phosphatase